MDKLYCYYQDFSNEDFTGLDKHKFSSKNCNYLLIHVLGAQKNCMFWLRNMKIIFLLCTLNQVFLGFYQFCYHGCVVMDIFMVTHAQIPVDKKRYYSPPSLLPNFWLRIKYSAVSLQCRKDAEVKIWQSFRAPMCPLSLVAS